MGVDGLSLRYRVYVRVERTKLARNVIVLYLRTTSMLSPTDPYYPKRRGFATSQAKVPQIPPGRTYQRGIWGTSDRDREALALKELYLLTEILPTHFLFR